jgi:hypothetical protein
MLAAMAFPSIWISPSPRVPAPIPRFEVYLRIKTLEYVPVYIPAVHRDLYSKFSPDELWNSTYRCCKSQIKPGIKIKYGRKVSETHLKW